MRIKSMTILGAIFAVGIATVMGTAFANTFCTVSESNQTLKCSFQESSTDSIYQLDNAYPISAVDTCPIIDPIPGCTYVEWKEDENGCSIPVKTYCGTPTPLPNIGMGDFITSLGMTQCSSAEFFDTSLYNQRSEINDCGEFYRVKSSATSADELYAKNGVFLASCPQLSGTQNISNYDRRCSESCRVDPSAYACSFSEQTQTSIVNICSLEYAPVCAQKPGENILRTYSNRCSMDVEGARFISEGECEKNTVATPDPSPDIPNSCTSWYDGCNTCGVENGELTFCTLRACSVYTESYCASYENNTPVPNTPSSLTENTSSTNTVCPALYNPICAKTTSGDLVTYSNTCVMESNNATLEYQGECRTFAEPEQNVEIPNSCTSWYDGCNTCMVENGEITACTKIACSDYGTPSCRAFEDTITPIRRTLPFSDIESDTLEANSAVFLYENDVIEGFADGEFKGEQFVNRAEAAKFIINVLYEDFQNDVSGDDFWDTPNGEWYIPYISKASEMGLITGYNDGTFRPANTVNTAEFLAMLSRLDINTRNTSASYNDVSSSDWFYEGAIIAQEYNLFPRRTRDLSPSSFVTREELAVALYQLINSNAGISLNSRR